MANKSDEIDLRTDDVQDDILRENFQRIEDYIESQSLLLGQWKFFSLEATAANNNFKLRHHLNFVPKDVIVTHVEGDHRFVFNYSLFDDLNIDVDISGPVRIRGFVGRFADNREETPADAFPTVSGGAATTDHSLLSNLSNDDHLQYLNEARHDALPADNPHAVTFTQAVTADAGTNITAAEAEQLTDGSNADSLHSHASVVGKVTKTMDCAASVAVNDWVYQDATTNNLAIEATNNTATEPVIGIVESKPTSTTCVVILVGVYAFSVVGRGIIRLGTSGTAVLTIPSTGYLQELGVTFGDGNILVNPNLKRIKRS